MSAGQLRPAAFPERIVLTGFMGAGKSTVGRILAARLGWRFFDTDALIAAQHYATVAEIFRLHGEAHFRTLELEAIERALTPPHSVVALGGGAVETPAVRDLLFTPTANTAVTVYLEAPLPELIERCSPHAAARPLLATAETPEQRLLRRQPLYQQAHLTVATSGQSPESVVQQILDRLHFQNT